MIYTLNPDGSFQKADDSQLQDSTTRQILETKFESGTLSTIFLGLDHNLRDSGDPILFETMYFSEESLAEEQQFRYKTKQEAINGHFVQEAILLANGHHVIERKCPSDERWLDRNLKSINLRTIRDDKISMGES
jgi:hypothetical protein